MPVTWDAAKFAEFYRIRIRWPDPDDPGNVNGERIGEVIGYGKDFARYVERGPAPFWFWLKRAAWLIQRLETVGLLPTHRILVVGAGFGFLPYCFRHASVHPQITNDFPLTYSIELNNSYIETNWDTQKLGLDSDPVVFDDWTENNKVRVRNKLETMTGGFSTFHVIINWVTESYQIEDPLTQFVNQTELDGLNAMLDACELGLVGTGYRRIVHMLDNPLLTGQNVDYVPVGERTSENRGKHDVLVDEGTALLTLSDWSTIRPTHTWLDTRNGEYILGTAS